MQARLYLWSGKTQIPSTGPDRGQTSSLSPEAPEVLLASPTMCSQCPHSLGLSSPAQDNAAGGSHPRGHRRGRLAPELYSWSRKGFSWQKPGTPASNPTLASPVDLSQPLEGSSASTLQIRKLRLREAGHHLWSPSLQAVGPCLPRSWGGGHAPLGRGRSSGILRLGEPTAPLRPPCLHPEHLNSGKREPPSHTQPRNQAAAKESDPWAESRSCHRHRGGGTRAGEGWAGRGSSSYLGRGATGGALSNSLSPETLRGAREGRHDLGDPSEPRGPLDYALPRAMVRQPACECWTGSALTAVLQAWALGQHSGREPGALAPFIQGHPATSPTGSPCFSQGKGPSLPKITRWQGLSLREPLGPGHLLGCPGCPKLWVGAKGAGAGPTGVGRTQNLPGPNLKSQFHPRISSARKSPVGVGGPFPTQS